MGFELSSENCWIPTKGGEVFQGLEEHEWEQGWVHPSLVFRWGEGSGD